LIIQKDTILNFVLELFNAKHISQIKTVNAKSAAGLMNIESYAKAIEKIEHTSKAEAIDLLRKCKFARKKVLDEASTDLETHLWNKEFDCHTDKTRQRWIQSYAEAYCEKHPKAKSCSLQEEDFCDHYAVMRLPKHERYLLRMSRLCENLAKLPQKVKEWHAWNIQTHCESAEDLSKKSLGKKNKVEL
jgi:hypothetical protein